MTVVADLKTQFTHGVLPVANSDEFARQEFVKSLKFHLASQVSVGNKDAFEGRAARRQGLRRRGAAVCDDILLTRPALFSKTEQSAELRVVAVFGMRIQRQVVSEQADVMLQQQANAATARAGDAPVLAFPEVAVVHQQRIGAHADRRLDQRLAGAYSGNEAQNPGAPFHLQAVWAIIAKARHFEQLIEVAGQVITLHHASLFSLVQIRAIVMVVMAAVGAMGAIMQLLDCTMAPSLRG